LSKATCCILPCPVIAADVLGKLLMTAKHSAINPHQRV
jgi:hypothetical protein